MTHTLRTLIPAAQSFFTELAANNSKDWFAANKARYEADLKTPALALLEAVSPHVAALADAPVKTKLYRAHRDVRFSKDKSPYKLHLHMLWAPQGTGTQPAYFFGIAPEYVRAGAGIMGFDKEQLSQWRAFASEREGAELAAKIARSGARMDPPALKRVPAPFAQDHTNADLIKRKSCALWLELADDADLEDGLRGAFSALNPVMDDLRAFL